jgi:hypothetical protein
MPKKIKKPMRDIIGIINGFEDYLSAAQPLPPPFPEGSFDPRQSYRDPDGLTKLGYAIRRVKPQLVKHYQEHANLLEDVNITYALTEKDDGKGKILVRKTEQGNEYDLDRAGTVAVFKRHRELLDIEYEIEPYFTTAVPDHLPARLFDLFIGIVIDPAELDRLDQRMTASEATGEPDATPAVN